MQFNRDERKRFERRLLDLMASVKDERGHALAVLLAMLQSSLQSSVQSSLSRQR